MPITLRTLGIVAEVCVCALNPRNLSLTSPLSPVGLSEGSIVATDRPAPVPENSTFTVVVEAASAGPILGMGRGCRSSTLPRLLRREGEDVSGAPFRSHSDVPNSLLKGDSFFSSLFWGFSSPNPTRCTERNATPRGGRIFEWERDETMRGVPSWVVFLLASER